jgi:hypothetical protein
MMDFSAMVSSATSIFESGLHCDLDDCYEAASSRPAVESKVYICKAFLMPQVSIFLLLRNSRNLV